TQRSHTQRVLGLADRFVGGEHDRQIPVGQFLTQAGHVLDAGDRLFEVLEVEVGEFGAGALRLGEAVAGVRVQAQRGVGQDPTELPQAGEVIGERVDSVLGDLRLDGADVSVPGQYRLDLFGRAGRQRGVDSDG